MTCVRVLFVFFFFSLFFFNDTATTEIYTLSLHDALPILLACISLIVRFRRSQSVVRKQIEWLAYAAAVVAAGRSEEHTSELQSRGHLVCRLLLEKKKKK